MSDADKTAVELGHDLAGRNWKVDCGQRFLTNKEAKEHKEECPVCRRIRHFQKSRAK